MSEAAGALTLAGGAAACPQCARTMETFALEGHYGQQVATDLCAHCNLIWFDEFESVRLSGLGWVSLLRRMHAAMDGGASPLRTSLQCPRCSAPLNPANNLTRFGRFASLECTRKHGHLQTFSLLLAERGFVRPLSAADARTLAQEGNARGCLNCGAPLESRSDRCTHCDSPLVVIDMPRLMTALLMRHGEPLPQDSAQRSAWPCRGCGAPVEPTRGARCGQCHHAVVVPSVVDLKPLLDKVEPMLRAAQPRQARPHGEKLRRMRGDHRATGLHSVMRDAVDLLGGDGRGSGGTALVIAILIGAAVWFFLLR